jgi:hypothetical protein
VAAQEVSAARQAVDDSGLDTPSAELLERLNRTGGVKPRDRPVVSKPEGRADKAKAESSVSVRSPP